MLQTFYFNVVCASSYTCVNKDGVAAAPEKRVVMLITKHHFMQFGSVAKAHEHSVTKHEHVIVTQQGMAAKKMQILNPNTLRQANVGIFRKKSASVVVGLNDASTMPSSASSTNEAKLIKLTAATLMDATPQQANTNTQLRAGHTQCVLRMDAQFTHLITKGQIKVDNTDLVIDPSVSAILEQVNLGYNEFTSHAVSF